MFERYTEDARRAIFFARYEASQSGAREIGSIHLLLGIIRESRRVFTEAGLQGSLEDLAEDCRKALPLQGEKLPTSVDMPLTHECTQALSYAAEQAEIESSRNVTSRHLALGLMKASADVTAILREHGVTAENLGAVKHSHPEAAASTHAPGVVLEFVCHGEQIASVPADFSAMPPGVGDEVAFTHEAKTETFKVLNVRHFYEGSALSGLIRGRLTKLEIEVEDVTPAAP
jgi:ATP-dependent Clp protease ATP-binding subunit ClpA